MKNKLYLMMFVTMLSGTSFAQSGVIVAGGDSQNVSYTIGAGLVELQIPIAKQVSLGVPKFELPEPSRPKPSTKKKSFFEKLMQAILKLFKK